MNRGWSLLLAKIWFVVMGYVLVMVLSRILPRPDYGDWYVANSAVSFVGTVLIAGTLGSVSHQVARPGADPAAVRAAALRAHLVVGAVATIALALGSGPLGLLLGDERISHLLLLASPIPGCYAVYATHVGVMNGLRRYGRQALFDAGFSTAKCLLVAGAVGLGFGVEGAIAGFTVASVLVVLPATFASEAGSPRTAVRARDVLRFSAVTLAHVVAMNAALHADTMVVKARCGSEAVAAYGGAAQIARVPLQVIVALTLVYAPVIASRATGELSAELRRATERLVVCAVAVAACAAALFSAAPSDFVVLLLGRGYFDAADILVLSAPAMGLYVLTHVCTAGLVAAGRPAAALAASALLVVTQTALLLTGVGRGTGLDGARAAAEACLVASGLAAAVSFVLLSRVTGLRLRLRVLFPLVVALGLHGAAVLWRATHWGFVAEVVLLGGGAAASLVWARCLPLPTALDARFPRAPWLRRPGAADDSAPGGGESV